MRPYMARSHVYPGLGEVIIETDPTRLVRELHATAVALFQAKQRGDVTGVRNLLEHFKAVADAYRKTGASDLTTFDRLILSTGDWVEKAVAAVPGAVAAIPRAIGSGLLQGALPFLLLFGLWAVVSGRSGGGSQWR